MRVKVSVTSVQDNMWIKADQSSVKTLCEVILRVLRDEVNCKDRQKSRFVFLVEQYDVEEFKYKIKEEVALYDCGAVIEDEQPRPKGHFEYRSLV